MILIKKYAGKINSIITSESGGSYRVASAVVAVFVFLIGFLLIKAGAPRIRSIPWDIMTVLDGAWRINCGQVPHNDFYSHTGALTYYATFLGMKLGRAGLGAVTMGTVCVMAVLAPLGFLAVMRRASAFYTALFTIYLGALIVAPRALGEPYTDTSYAMLYNRYGEAYLAVLVMVLFLKPRDSRPSPWLDAFDGGVAGMLMAALWFTKISYFAVAVGFFSAAIILRFITLRKTVAYAACAAVWIGGIHFLSGISFATMLDDIRLVIGGQNVDARLSTLLKVMAKDFFLVPVLMLFAWELSLRKRPEFAGWLGRLRNWSIPLLALGAAIVIRVSNAQYDEEPLLIVAAIIGAEMIRRDQSQASGDPAYHASCNIIAVGLVAFFMLPITETDLKSIRSGASKSRGNPVIYPQSFKHTRLEDYVLFEDLTSSCYADLLDECMALLRRHANPSMRLSSLTYSNPYCLALGIKPAHGGIICIHSNLMSAKCHPQLRRLIGDATHVLISRNPIYFPRHVDTFIHDCYGAEWDALGLTPVEETPNFILLKVAPE